MQNGFFPSIHVITVIILYNQPQLFTILAMRTYLKTTYRENN